MNPKYEDNCCKQYNTDKGEKRMRYIVKIDYKRFYFEDRLDAMMFAETALQASNDDVNVEVEIHLDKGEE